MNNLNYEEFDIAKDDLPHEFDFLRLRLRRAISWGKLAEQLSDDLAVRFIFLWIGFNAIYSRDPDMVAKGESVAAAFHEIKKHLKVLVPLDSECIYKIFWKGEAFEACLSLMEDEYLFQSFWKLRHTKSRKGEWREEWEANKNKFSRVRQFNNTQKREKIPIVLTCTIFNRLCVLRNQVMHGSATHKSSKNLHALRRGVIVMERFLPTCIDLMLKNPGEDWGAPRYRPDEEEPA